MHAHTEAAVKEILSLPIHGESPLEDVDYVCDAILEFFDKWGFNHEPTRKNTNFGERTSSATCGLSLVKGEAKG